MTVACLVYWLPSRSTVDDCTMSVLSAASLVGRQARIHIEPTPQTLSESSAILKALQAFGTVATFINPRYVSAARSRQRSDFFAIYSEDSSLTKALSAAPLSVEVGQDQADPREADPFNIRGLQDRKPVEQKTFKCSIFIDEDDSRHKALVEANPYHGPFQIDRHSSNIQDLMAQGAPLPQIADAVWGPRQDRESRQWSKGNWEASKYFAKRRREDGRADLMEMWKQGLREEAERKRQGEEPLKISKIRITSSKSERLKSERLKRQHLRHAMLKQETFRS